MNFNESVFVSVIVPVLNDSCLLKKCLFSLENQTYPKDFYEVIVVDNGSDENIKEVVNKFSQTFMIYENQRGSYKARNTGISIAKGQIIAFTDADCIPDSDWIEKGVGKLLDNSECGLVVGQIKFYYKNPDRPTAVEFYDSIIFLNQKKYVEEKFGATANIFTWASLFQTVGLFNADLKSSGDREWGNRVNSYGYKIIYAEDACVYHPARGSLNQLYKKIIRLTRGSYVLNKEPKSFKKFLLEVPEMLKPPLKFIRWRYADKRLINNATKILFIFVTLLIYYGTALEKIRLEIQRINQKK
jgi:glycosyltransferase involved in cell wall biosynthesis